MDSYTNWLEFLPSNSLYPTRHRFTLWIFTEIQQGSVLNLLYILRAYQFFIERSCFCFSLKLSFLQFSVCQILDSPNIGFKVLNFIYLPLHIPSEKEQAFVKLELKRFSAWYGFLWRNYWFPFNWGNLFALKAGFQRAA